MSKVTIGSAPVAQPMFGITRGNPTAEEIAAVTVVLTAAASSGGEERPVRRSPGWSNRRRVMTGWTSASGWGSR